MKVKSMACRTVTPLLLAAGLLAGCQTFDAVRRDLGLEPPDAPPRMAQNSNFPAQFQPMAPAPAEPGSQTQANWVAHRAAVLNASNQVMTAPVGYVAPADPAMTAAAPAMAPAPATAMASAMPTNTAPLPRARPAQATPAMPAAAMPTPAMPTQAASMAAPGLPAGYRPSPSVVDNPAAAMDQQKTAAAAGATPDAPMAAGMMKAAGNGMTGSATTGGWRAHLASHRTEAAAINEWQELLAANPALYGQFDPQVEWADTPGRGAFARLVLTGFADRKAADDACAKLRTGTRYCAAIAAP